MRGARCAGAAIVALLAVGAAPAAEGVDGEAGELGLGAVAPDPLGGTLKWFVVDDHALEVAAGFDGTDADEVVLRASWLYHFTDLWDLGEGHQLPLYVGAGARFAFYDDGHHDHGRGHDDHDHHDTGFGIRAPVGVAWWPPDQPFEVFVELALLFETEPHDDIDLTVAGGIRWYP